MLKNNVYRATKLYVVSKEKRKAFQKAFVLPCTRKSLNNLIESTWKVQNAKATIEREKRSRMQVLKHSG